MCERFMALWPKDVRVRAVPHAEFKEMTRQARAVVRTGEFTPYRNVIFIAASCSDAPGRFVKPR